MAGNRVLLAHHQILRSQPPIGQNWELQAHCAAREGMPSVGFTVWLVFDAVSNNTSLLIRTLAGKLPGRQVWHPVAAGTLLYT